MRIAIVHDDFIQIGGAERLVLAMLEVFPQAEVYTTVVSPAWQHIFQEKGVKYHTSFLQSFPLVSKLNRYYSVFLLHAIAFGRFNLSEFDVVLSSSSRYAHNVITKPETLHICYMNTPGRMFWDSSQYFENESYGLFKYFKFFAKAFLSIPLFILRINDFISAQRVDYFIANSKTPQNRIAQYYRRSSDIIYPFVEYAHFQKVQSRDLVEAATPYFLLITRLLPWKKVDIAIKACIKLNLNLKIIGVGSDLARLKKIANKNPKIEFLGYGDDNLKARLFQGCQALIQTQREDFGIVPLEALASGKPVIAFGSGGVLEIVKPGVTGEFYFQQTPESLVKVLSEFNTTKYDPVECRKQAQKFDKINFATQIKDYVLRHYQKNT